MVKKEKATIEELFSRLHVYSEKDEHEGVLDCATRILAQNSSDETALRAKIIALVNLDKFTEAYKAFEGNDRVKEDLKLAYGYVLYKLNKVDDLEKLDTSVRGIQHELAQAYYKKEDFKKVHLVYEQIEKEGEPVVVNESFDMAVNQSAVVAQRLLNGQEAEIRDKTETGSYDEMFNIATAYIGLGKYDEALEWLRQAKLGCENAENLSDEEINTEVFPIMVQAAYANQLKGNVDEAIKILEGLDLYNPKTAGDPAVRNVAINNLLTMKGEDNPHYMIRLLDSAGDYSTFVEKQVNKQTEVLGYNRLLLHNLAGRNITSMAKKFVKQHPSKAGIDAIGLLSQLPQREDEKLSTRTKKLRKLYTQQPTNIALAFALAQLYYNDNKLDSATSSLEELHKNLKSNNSTQAYLPGLVGALVNLFKLQGRDTAISALLNESLEQWSNDENSPQELIATAASTLAGSDDPSLRSKAQQSFTNLLETNPREKLNIAGVLASSSNPDSLLSSKLEPIDQLVANVNVQSINEAGVHPLLQTRKRKAVATTESSKPRKRTRKPRLPKDYDPSKQPDPERWMPKRDRSTYKPKKKDKKNIKNTQGGQGDATATESGISSTNSSSVKTSSNKNKKKKKGKK
jgi:signal recognition particle subunit SRP72